jgi:hypothetical protein
MKTGILQKVLPFAAIVLAVAGAFAANISRTTTNSLADVNGRLPSSCQETSVVCSDIFNPQMCTSGAQQLYKINASGIACPQVLYKKVQ